MLIEFRVENFGSIKEEQVLSLVASNYYKDLPDNVFDPDLPGLSGVKLLKGAAIYGPNASGKSTLIKAMGTLQQLVIQSAMRGPEAPLPQRPFCLDEASCAAPTSFFVAFVQAGVRYEYELSYTAKRVLRESLTAFPKKIGQLWFERVWDATHSVYEWRRPGALKVSSELLEMVRENALFLSVGAHFNNPQLGGVREWFTQSLKVLNLGADANVNALDPGFSAELVKGSSHLRERLLDLLRHADLGVVSADVVQAPPEAPTAMLEALGKFLQPEVLAEVARTGATMQSIKLGHQTPSSIVPIDFAEESAGTQRLFALAGPWLDILEHGYTVFIDELDASLHPVLIQALLGVLFSPQTNPLGAQVVFTTHNPYLLAAEILRRDQIWFTEKDGGGATHLYPLSDYKPRPKESLISGYLAGRYGAVPMIPPGMGI